MGLVSHVDGGEDGAVVTPNPLDSDSHRKRHELSAISAHRSAKILLERGHVVAQSKTR